MKLTIDLATRILSEKMQVHLVRPGGGYSLYEIVLKEQALAADAPFLRIQDGSAVPAANKIASELERARVLRTWAKQSTSSRGPRPSVGLESYRLDLVDQTRAAQRTKIRNAANQILWKIPGGTLVVVPSRSLSGSAVLAEIESRKNPRIEVSGGGKYEKLLYPARRIRNLKLVPMVELPESVIESSRTVRVVEKLSGHGEDRVLRMYYGDYQRGKDLVAGLIAGAEDFDARIVGLIIELHLAIQHVLETGESLPLGSALFNAHASAGPFFHARVDSPDGRAHLESSSIATFVVKLLMVVALSGVPSVEAAQALEEDCVAVLNGANGDRDEIVEASREALVNFAQTSGYECVATYVEALQDGLNRNNASVNGSATLDQ